ncbi:MAG: efflux RND transporter periplasmic adaptor subunit [Gemmatimonadetes bacterium]|nr:efflux RND transporter periplasmic adaptor subunit [Gemmatimonadota bacterium]
MIDHETSPTRAERSPFDSASAAGRNTALRWGLFTVIVGGGVAGAWWFTRAASVPPVPVPVATDATNSVGNPVMLTADAAKRIGVTYAVVERTALRPEIRAVGVVTYDETRMKSVAAKVDGYVEQLFVSYTGQPVEENDPVLRLYSPMLVTAQEELLLARKLLADVASGDADAVRNASALVASARRRLQYWDVPDADVARIERTGEVQKTLTLRSPLRGVVMQKNVLAGQRIMAGEAVYQVADLRTVWLECELFERDLAAVRVGQSVTAEFEFAPDKRREGRVTFVAPTVAAETRTTKVRVELPNADGALKPGMYATIILRGDARRDVLSVPRSAVLVTGTRVLVFVKSADGMLTPREVTLGETTEDRVEILRGVVAGESLVASATFLVDAESNLGSALGAMANMPGMDMGAPKPASGSQAPPAGATGAATSDPMANMPGMDHGAKKPDPMANMPGMDHSAKKPDPMANMPGMNHSPKKP